MCLGICQPREGPSFVAEAGEGVLRWHTRACPPPGKLALVKVPEHEQGSSTVLRMYKKPVPSRGWIVTKSLLRLDVSLGFSAQSRLRTVGSPQ